MAHNALRRSRSDRILGGVLGGIAAHYGWDSTVLRVVFVVVSVLSVAFPGILIYIALWIIMPDAEADQY